MLSLTSVWIGLATLLLALAMVLHRPAFTDITIPLVLYFGSPGALCLSIMVLWAHRRDSATDQGLNARRLQAKVAIALAISAAAIVYTLINLSEKSIPIEPGWNAHYNRARMPKDHPTTLKNTGTSRNAMQVTLNGQPDTMERETSVAQLLDRLELQPIRVAVELNEEIVARKTFGDTMIREGDRIEIVTFVGGG